MNRQSWSWLALQLGLGLGWLALLASRAPRPESVAPMLLLACSVYLPLFFFNVAWFVPLAVLPRGLLTELLLRPLLGWRTW